MIKKVGINVILFVYLFTAGIAQQKDVSLHFRSWGIDDGLSQVTCNAMWQDSQGFIWVGTQDGLNRFDGNSFKQYKYDSDSPGSIKNNYITSIFADSQQQLWIGTVAGIVSLFNPETDQFENFELSENKSSLVETVSCIYKGVNGQLYVGTANGLFSYNPSTNTFISVVSELSNTSINTLAQYNASQLLLGTTAGVKALNTTNATLVAIPEFNSLSSKNISVIMVDNVGSYWIGTDDGLYVYDRNFVKLQQLSNNKTDSPLSNSWIKSIYQDRNNNIWIGTDVGLNRYNPSKSSLDQYYSIATDNRSIPDNDIRTIYEDKAGNIWVGTDGGLAIHNPKTEQFMDYPEANNLVIYKIYEDKAGLIWYGTDGAGLWMYNPFSNTYHSYQHKIAEANSISDNVVWDIFEDTQNNFWIATSKGLNLFDKNTKQFTHYKHSQKDSTSISSNEVRLIYQDRNQVLWVGTSGGGLNRFNPTNGTFERLQTNNEKISNDYIRAILEDANGNFWVGTYGGGLNKLDFNNGTFSSYQNNQGDTTSISNNIIYHLHEDSKNNFWVGTSQGLNLLDRTTETFHRWNEKDGLSNEVIYGILEDSAGKLWLSTNKGINRFDAITGQIVTFEKKDGLRNDEYNVGAFAKGRNGKLYFGGIDGFNSFFPNNISLNSYASQPVITDFLLFNQPVNSTESAHLNKAITRVQQVNLQYDDYIFAFEFASLNYHQPEQNQYAYMLENFDNDWIYTDASNRKAVFTNVPPGKYVFKVKASNNEGRWNNTPTTINIHISPPWWLTWWAKFFWALLLIAIFATGFRIRLLSFKKQKRLLEKTVKERTNEVLQQKGALEKANEELRNLNQERTGMMSIVAHDLKSPLNNILSFIHLLEIGGNSEEEKREYMGKIKEVIGQGTRLIRDLVDIHRREENQASINSSEIAMDVFIKKRVSYFNQLMEDKKQKIVFELQSFSITTDESDLSRIMDNLLSNAMKFSPTASTITVKAKLEENRAILSVKDEGPGISKQDEAKLFKPFQKLTARPTGGEHSTGLGLSIVKTLTQKLGGEIELQTALEKGCEFIVKLPLA